MKVAVRQGRQQDANFSGGWMKLEKIGWDAGRRPERLASFPRRTIAANQFGGAAEPLIGETHRAKALTLPRHSVQRRA